MIDIRDYPKILDAANAVLNNGGIAEIKVEKWANNDERLTVVEQTRSVKSNQQIKDK